VYPGQPEQADLRQSADHAQQARHPPQVGLRARSGEHRLVPAVDEDQAGHLIGMPVREQPDQRPAVGPSDEHVRRLKPDPVQHGLEVVGPVAECPRQRCRIVQPSSLFNSRVAAGGGETREGYVAGVLGAPGRGTGRVSATGPRGLG
jgi:hypothetical protein